MREHGYDLHTPDRVHVMKCDERFLVSPLSGPKKPTASYEGTRDPRLDGQNDTGNNCTYSTYCRGH